MKHYRDQSYYELLEVSPDASLDEITRAYQSAQEAFNPDSVAIYSLFDSDEEREALLDRIQNAYRILSNGRTRREYDRQLGRGPAPEGEEFEPDEPGRDDIEPEGAGPEIPFQWEPDLADDRWAPADPPEEIKKAAPGPKPLPSLIRSEGIPLDVEPGGRIFGKDLIRLRESRGIGLSELAERIRVGRGTLRDLEADRHEGLPALIYVKGFLRAYAQVLKVDPKVLIEAYVLGMKADE